MSEDWDNADDDGWGQEDDGWDDQIQEGTWQEEVKVPEMDKKQSSLNSKTRVMTMKEVENQIPNLVSRANDLLCRDNEDDVIAILRHFDWNQTRLEEQWFDSCDRLELKIGIRFDAELEKHNPDIHASRADKNGGMCLICYCPFDPNEKGSEAVQMSCGHQFCSTCWAENLKTKVKSEGTSCVFAKCPQLKCNMVIPHSHYLKYLEDKKDPAHGQMNFRKTYLKWHLKQFTDHNKSVLWCPNKECDNIIVRSEFDLDDSVKCTCGCTFCLKCSQEDHVPTSCDLAKRWIDKESNEGENVDWLRANTKPCPKCHTNIEKNQGCNHMTCYKCKHDFCWLCLTEWQKHGSGTGGYYACNIFDTKKKQDKNFQSEQEIIEKSKNKLIRYQFYYERYSNHQKSKEICRKQISKFKEGSQKLFKVKNFPHSELIFFEEAAEEIIACRQVLKWTYCTGFFVEEEVKPHQIELFKFQQQELEQACEDTHKLLESDLSPYLDSDSIDRSPFYNFRSKLINLKDTLRQRRQHMLDNTENIMALCDEVEQMGDKEKGKAPPAKKGVTKKKK